MLLAEQGVRAVDAGEFGQILRAAQAGRRTAVGTLYRNFNPILVRFLRAQAPGMGEDLAHDTWLVVGAKLPDFAGDERAFRVWLLSIARVQLARQRGSSGRLRTTTVDPHALSNITRRWEPDDLSAADTAIAQLLAGLPPCHAEILLLRVVGGLSAEETGALVDKSPGAVRVIQHRALHKLAKRLSAERVTR
jgi:RNA polymerase sigma-70 factor (ECF subfamily)